MPAVTGLSVVNSHEAEALRGRGIASRLPVARIQCLLHTFDRPLSRIFLKNPPVLILDEATSALDSLTEAKIQHAFDELAKDRTTLIIAHRLSTIRAASRILVVSDGDIVESGTHAELMAMGGVYARLCKTQNLLA